ncbi:MAG TPA: C40 family peptidase [Draconibacterium sp.]|nr:C40 family peptidase [Draconibacterium sp.]
MIKRFLTLIILLLLTISIQSRQTTGTHIEFGESKNSSTIVNRTAIIEFAKNYLGVPYQYGSINPEKGFDCSGFVHFVFNNFDINLPHSSKAFKNLGKEIKPEEFKVGDVLVFYGYRNTSQIGHVGIICEANGMNSKFIHSSSGKVKGVTISELNSEMYSRRFYKCIDVFEHK